MIAIERCVAGFLIPSAKNEQGARVRTILRAEGGHGATAAAEPAVDHSRWDFVLHRLITPETTVDGISTSALAYSVLVDEASEEAVAMEEYRQTLSTCDLDAIKADDIEYAALLINAYNVFAVGLLVEYMRKNGSNSLASINNLSTKGFFSGRKVWDMEAGILGGRSFTLNQIEHGHLRREWAEPCFHACIVCASLSCPDLRAEAYVPAKLREQLDDQMRRYLSNPTKGLKVSSPKGGSGGGGAAVQISRIFLWFERDFLVADASLQDYVLRYVDEETKANISEAAGGGVVRWDYFVYNWNMNRSD